MKNATAGAQIVDLRTKAGLTQRELAALLGVSASSVHAWEVDSHGAGAGLRRVAEALAVPLDAVHLPGPGGLALCGRLSGTVSDADAWHAAPERRCPDCAASARAVLVAVGVEPDEERERERGALRRLLAAAVGVDAAAPVRELIHAARAATLARPTTRGAGRFNPGDLVCCGGLRGNLGRVEWCADDVASVLGDVWPVAALQVVKPAGIDLQRAVLIELRRSPNTAMRATINHLYPEL